MGEFDGIEECRKISKGAQGWLRDLKNVPDILIFWTPLIFSGIRILEWHECDRGVTIMSVQILIAEGKHGKVKIVAQSSYDTIVQRISGI